MLELNYWFFVLAANFLALLFVLNRILFRPLLKIFEERREAITGSLEKAKELGLRREETLEALKKDFAAASAQAREAFNSLRAEGLADQKRMLEAASEEASRILESARGELRAEAEKARASLRADVEKFSEEIVSKLVAA